MSVRVLRPLGAKKVEPRPFLTYDFEWYPETKETLANGTAYKIRLVSGFNGSRAFGFCHKGFGDKRPFPVDDPVGAFVKALLVPDFDRYLFFAHWGGIADTLYLFRKIHNMGYPTRIVVNGSAASIITVDTCSKACGVKACNHHKYKWQFVDSSFIFRMGLAALAESMGKKKGGDGNLTWDTENDEDLTTYNYLDNEILYEAIDKGQTILNGMGGKLCLTMSASSLDLIRRKYLKDVICTPEEENDFAKQAYYASRVENYRFTMPSGHGYDVNSSFVYSMTHTLPGSPIRQSWGKLPEDLKGMWIADVTVEVPEMYLPPLPYRHSDGRIFFPTGTWDGVFTSVDIELALSVGCKVTEVRRVVHYEKRDDLKAFAEDVYRERMKPGVDKFRYMNVKLVGNGGYGKFGEGEEKEEYLVNPDSTICEEHYKKDKSGAPVCRSHGVFSCERCYQACECMTQVTPGVWKFKTKRKIHHRHVQVVSFITSIARRTLYLGQYTYQHLLAYSDTDSLHLSDVISEENRHNNLFEHTLVSDSILGGLKYEGAMSDMIYLGPKLYSGKDKHGDPILKAKGFRIGGKVYDPEKCRKVYNLDSVAKFETLMRGEPVYDSRMVRPKEFLKRFLNVDRPYDVLVGKNGKRLTLSNRPKRKRVGENETRPWTVEELQREERWL